MVWRRKRTAGADKISGTNSTGSSGPETGGPGVAPLASTGVGHGGAAKADGGLTPRNSDQFADYSTSSTPSFEPLQARSSSMRSYCVPRGYRVSADLFSSRQVVVLGELEGKDLVTGLVTVLPGGTLRGSSRVETLRVAGLIEGSVQAKVSIDVASQGEIRGNVSTPSMRVVPGARMSHASLRIGNG